MTSVDAAMTRSMVSSPLVKELASNQACKQIGMSRISNTLIKVGSVSVGEEPEHTEAFRKEQKVSLEGG